ncbi:MAG: DUF2334 domain-containing protein [Acidimicrobiales bacterium]
MPEGRKAAVCFTIDDIHPGRSTDAYEAGGDMGAGALGHLEWLLDRHPDLNVTLFATADWRELSPFPTRRLIGRIPVLRDNLYLTRTLRRGTMRLDRHLEFVTYLRSLPRTEIALHGLHHVHRGASVQVEFQDQSAAACAAALREAMGIFAAADLPAPTGMTPPGWQLTTALADAMVTVGLTYVASARDVVTSVSPVATTAMSGRHGVSLIYPELIEAGRLVHLPSNVQATSPIDRALDIADHGGLVSVKAHIVKRAFGHVHLDGLDELYRNYLDLLFGELRRRYGEELWWPTMGEVAHHVRAVSRDGEVVSR